MPEVQEKQAGAAIGEGKSTIGAESGIRREKSGTRNTDSIRSSIGRVLQATGTGTEISASTKPCTISLHVGPLESPTGYSVRTRYSRPGADLSKREKCAVFFPCTELLATKPQQVPHLAQFEPKS